MSLFRTLTGQSGKSHQSQEPQQLSPTQSKSQTRPPLQQSQSRGAAADPWTGHLNHLSKAQEDALGKFKVILYDQALYSPVSDTGAPSHDDATLLRFLRARKFDVNGALGQFKDTEKWRIENKIDDLYRNIDVDFYEKARTMYPQWTGRRDRRGIPLYVYVIRHLDTKNVAQYTKDSASMKAQSTTHASSKVPSKLLPLFALYENMLNFVLPLCDTLERPNPECPATNCTNIVDVSGCGIKQFWSLKGHMQEASTLATAHYPETLDRIYILGAPSFFPTVWGWIKRWFDPVTVSKIFILSQAEIKPTLEKFVEHENIPKAYGGSLDWSFGQHPHLDEAAAMQCYKTGKDWIPGPLLWEDDQRVPVGTVNGQPRTSTVKVKQTVQVNGDVKDTKDIASGRIIAESAQTSTDSPPGTLTTGKSPTEKGSTSPVAKIIDDHIPLVNGQEKPVKNATTTLDTDLPATEGKADTEDVTQTNGIVKPPMERFETAPEIMPQANGAAS